MIRCTTTSFTVRQWRLFVALVLFLRVTSCFLWHPSVSSHYDKQRLVSSIPFVGVSRPFKWDRPVPALSATRTSLSETSSLVVGDCIGSGSYGTVHALKDDVSTLVGKRAWNVTDLMQRNATLDEKTATAKAQRCEYYYHVEEHCWNKLESHVNLPIYRGSVEINEQPWMTFDLVTDPIGTSPAPTLQDVFEQHHKTQQDHVHVLLELQQAMGIEQEQENPLVATLDTIMEQLLGVLVHIHSHAIVHRDVKPANLLIGNHFKLIDFGSAADIETAGLFKENIGWDDSRAAISPIYTAPEVFCDPTKAPANFDCFSVGLIACQLIFSLCDERADAGFHQQLEKCDWNLDACLRTELAGTVRPAGFVDALGLLEARPGLWRLLQNLLVADPQDRITSTEALEQWHAICAGQVKPGIDGPYLASVLEASQECPIPTTRALEFVATFSRNDSLGLILAEADAEDVEMDAADLLQWQQATQDALPGQVFVQGIVEGGQAEEMGIFEIGDHLQGVGELPVSQGGFEKVVEMLGQQPKSAKYMTLHFDRKSALVGTTDATALPIPSMQGPIQVSDQGAWSSRGRRKAQEDTFVLHEVHDTKDRSILLAGIMDGHLGTAASKLVQETLPDTFSELLLRNEANGDIPAESLLETAWDQTCEAYRSACTPGGECVAEYDPREGILMANTGSDDIVAGTTACIVALEKKTGHVAVLNCGDSRGIVIDGERNITFQTVDHKPQDEIERLTIGKKQGMDYGVPQCRMSRWFVPVGDYEYAVSRSLEGAFATSKGIISTPDVASLQVTARTTVMVASDGLYEVMDSNEVARILFTLRKTNMSAGDAAKSLCSMALEKGSSDNVSAVVLYLD